MKNKKLILVIAVLAIATLALGYMNKKSMYGMDKDEGTITFVWGDNTTTLSFEEITSLESHQFKATEDTSTSGPAVRKFKGVFLKDVLKEAGIDDLTVKSASKVVIKGLDGYVIAMAGDEALSDHVYLAFEKNGKPLGTLKSGGSGPFQLITVSDTFSQRWCKYVTEVTIE